MIKFRQKIFVAPLIPLALEGAMAVGTGLSLKQGMDQSKQAEELAARQEEQNKEITKALNRVAKSASKNPIVAQQAANVMSQKQFGINGGFIKNVTNLAKDVKNAAWTPGAKRFMKVGLASGAVMGGTGYIVDKAIQKDAKKIGLMNDNSSPQQKSYANVGSVLKKAGGFIKNNKTELGLSAGFSAIPAVGYLSERKQFLDQKKATMASSTTPQQRSYAFVPKMSGIKKMFQPMRDHWGQTVLGGVNKLVSFGGIGRKEVAGFGKRMAEGSSSEWGRKLGGFIQKNPKTALTGAIGVSLGVSAGSYGLGEKMVKKGAEAVDKNAFAYEKSKNQEIQ